MNNLIDKISAEEIKDSRNNPTLKVSVWSGEFSGSFSVPSGASTGAHEAHEFRDADGKGVSMAISNIKNLIGPALLGLNVLDQRSIDAKMLELDGTPNKDRLGGNAMIGVSIACAKVAAKVSGQEVFEYLRGLAKINPSREVPYLFMNLIEGGKHTKTGLAFQEYHVVPKTDDVGEALTIGIQINQTLQEIIQKDLGADSVIAGDEGGFSPATLDIKKPLLYLTQAVAENNLSGQVEFALDVAASSFFTDGIYQTGELSLDKGEFLSVYDSLMDEFKLLSIEDPFNEEDFSAFRELKEKHKGLLVVGDDLTVSNKKLLQKAIDEKSVNALIIKPNQIGTLSETLETMALARENGVEIIVSHRSGETEDDFIADLAYAFGCFGFKSGAPTQRERMVKYDRLKNISQNNKKS